MSTVNKEQLIGLLGGTFDPVHNGHLVVAEQAAAVLQLDRILFIPAADPPHKKSPGASYGHRVAMLEIALAETEQEKFQVSLLEVERATPSYTIDTLLELQKRLGKQDFYFIIGADSLLELHLWYRFRELIELTNFIVAARPGISMQAVERAIAGLPGPFTSAGPAGCWQRADGAHIHYLADVSVDISSSTVRSQLGSGLRPDTVSTRVLDYITEFGLYSAAVGSP